MNKIIITSIITALMLCSCGKQTEETKPTRKKITETVFASGILETSGTYNLTAGTDGFISELYIEENDEIKRGQTLGIIENKGNIINNKSGEKLYEIAKSNTFPSSPRILQARNEMEIARQRMEYDSSLFIRYKKLREAASISAAEFDKIELQYNISAKQYQTALQNYDIVKQQAEQQLIINQSQKEINRNISAFNQICASEPGRVLKKYKQTGDYVRQGEIIAKIGDTGSIYASVNVDEGSIGKVKTGQEVFIKLNVDKDRIYKGKVAEILPVFDESTQSFICKIAFTETPEFKIEGTQLQVNIKVGEETNAMLIPRKYLGYNGEVMIKGEAKPKKVKTGIISSEWVQVLDGLSENTIIIMEKVN